MASLHNPDIVKLLTLFEFAIRLGEVEISIFVGAIISFWRMTLSSSFSRLLLTSVTFIFTAPSDSAVRSRVVSHLLSVQVSVCKLLPILISIVEPSSVQDPLIVKTGVLVLFIPVSILWLIAKTLGAMVGPPENFPEPLPPQAVIKSADMKKIIDFSFPNLI